MRQLKITKSITSRDSQSLDKYLQEIGREQLLTVEEEVELSQRIRRGDRRAQDTLVRSNLRFVVSVAKQYQNQGLSLPDLINEGNMGLIKAAEKFDEKEVPSIVLATAHPSKFPVPVREATGITPVLPSRLSDLMTKRESFTVLPNTMDAIKYFIETAVKKDAE